MPEFAIVLNLHGQQNMAKKVIQLTGGSHPFFAWRLPQEIAAYKQPKLPAQQWAHVINGFAQKGIKLSEIIDSKVLPWLAEMGKEQVTREAVAEFVSFSLPSIKEARLSGSSAQYRQYSFAVDHEEYHESLFYFPTVTEDITDRIAELDDNIAALNFDFEALGRDPDAVFRLDRRRSELMCKQNEAASGGGLRTHFSANLQQMCPDARADFAHMRWSVKHMDGQSYLFVHELQSDWAQRGRKNDWQGDYKKAPLVTETEHWTSFLLRRAMLLAVEHGCDGVTWINGAEMANGSVIRGSAGLDEFYMKIVPGLAKKLAKPFCSELFLKSVVLKDRPRSLAVMPVTEEMREKFRMRSPVYSYARTVADSTFDPVRARQLEQALQLRADRSLGPDTAMRVSIVREIMCAHEGRRPAAALLGRTAMIAFDAADPVAALDHEGFHLAYRHGFSPKERETVERQFSHGAPLLVRTVRLLLSHGDNAAATQALSDPEEAAAHCYALWRQGQMPLSRIEGLAAGSQAGDGARSILQDVFPRVEAMVKSVCAWICGSSVSPTDFLAKIVRAHEAGRLTVGEEDVAERQTRTDPWTADDDEESGDSGSALPDQEQIFN